MRAPTRREQAFVLVFAVSLVWGAWTYRHLFTTTDPVAQTTILPVAANETSARTAAGEAPPSARPAPTQAWGSDPFNRPWRTAR